MTTDARVLSPSVAKLFDALPDAPQILSRGDDALLHAPLTALCDDSREAGRDSLFVCIRGGAVDGHRYLRAAYDNGCRYFLVEDKPGDFPPDAWIFRVENTRAALPRLAAAFFGRPADGMRVVGITGTKGKTTTALMLYHILRACGISAGYVGTSGALFADRHLPTRNTTPGPLALQKILAEMRDAGVDSVVMEVSSQALWQERVAGIPFAVSVFTNLSYDHIGAPEHPDFAHYKSCKKRLFTDCAPALVVANADDPATPELMADVTAPVILCGVENGEFSARDIRPCRAENGLPGVAFRFVAPEGETDVALPIPGTFNVSDALLALTVARALGIPPETAAPCLRSVRIPGRFETVRTPGGALIVIDYAHNGASLRAALSALRSLSPKRLYCLVGSVGGRTACRRPEIGDAVRAFADFGYFTADNPDRESVTAICEEIASVYPPEQRDRAFRVIPDRAEAIRYAVEHLEGGDILLLAGKGDEQYQLIDGVRVPYSDRAAVADALARLPL